MSNKYSAHGVLVKIATTATPTPVVGGVQSVSVTLGSRALIDVTAHDSTGTKSFIPNPLRETAEIEVSMLWDAADTSHTLIQEEYATSGLVYVTIVFPSAGYPEVVMSGYITAFSVPTLNVDGALELTWSFKAAGEETFTA